MTRKRWYKSTWLTRIALIFMMILIMSSALMIGGVVTSGNALAAIMWLIVGWFIYFILVLLVSLAFAFSKKGR